MSLDAQHPQRLYSLGGLRDDSEMFRAYFGKFPEWDPKISPLLANVRES